MRRTVDIDDALIEQAKTISGQSSEQAAVEASLQLLIQLRRQAGIRDLFGKIPLDNDLEWSRRS